MTHALLSAHRTVSASEMLAALFLVALIGLEMHLRNGSWSSLNLV